MDAPFSGWQDGTVITPGDAAVAMWRSNMVVIAVDHTGYPRTATVFDGEYSTGAYYHIDGLGHANVWPGWRWRQWDEVKP